MSQMTLFDLAESPAPEYLPPLVGPFMCDRCDTQVNSPFLLRLNHGVDPETNLIGSFSKGEHPIYGDHCLAQNLVMNHVISAIKQDRDPSPAIARARELNLDVDQLLEELQVNQ